jgi:hypothetical protein
MTGREIAPWHQLLTGTQRESALDAITSLTRTFSDETNADLSLATGAAGQALARIVLATTHGDHHAAAAAAELDRSAALLATESLDASLYSGFPGIAWATEMASGDVPSRPAEQDLARVDQTIVSLLRRYPATEPLGLADGLAGLGVYALARWPRPAAASSLASIVERLAGRARRDADGIFWPPAPRAPATRPAAAASQAGHPPCACRDGGGGGGMPGLIAFLARVHRLGVATRTVRPLLDGAVRRLLTRPQGGPGWLDSDLGAAVALLLAARDMDEPAWTLAGTELALRGAKSADSDARPDRQAPGQPAAGPANTGLCHGTAGLAHLLHRACQLTGHPDLADAARHWMTRTITLTRTSASATPGHPHPAGSGLMHGTAGVVLVIHAGCFPEEPRWDQMLLVSTPAGAAIR